LRIKTTTFTGYGTSLGHTVHQTFPFPKGIEGLIPNLVTGMLLACGVTIITALVLTMVGLVGQKPIDNKPSQSDKIK
jgi:predicted outer membrane lipoprotein